MKYSLRTLGIALVIIVAAGSLVAAHMITGGNNPAVRPSNDSAATYGPMSAGSYGMTGQGMMMTGNMMGYGMMGRHMMGRHMHSQSSPMNGSWSYCWSSPQAVPNK